MTSTGHALKTFFASVLVLGCALCSRATAQSWTQLAPGGAAPGVRTLHTAVLSPNNRMIVFGGLNGPGSVTTHPMFNDVWVLSNADASGGAPAWTQLAPTGTPPSARGYHTAVYDPANNRMIVFAGDPNIGFCNGAANDVWVLANADGTGGTPSWTPLNPTGGPPEMRQGTRAVYDAASNRMIAFGGGTNACQPLNDREVWVLANANGLGGPPAWARLDPQGPLPPARGHHILAYHPASNRMIVFGGSIVTGDSNDAWVLENANGLGGTPRWTQLSPSGTLPTPRSLAGAGYDPASNRMVVFGGSTPAGRVNEVWVLQNANGLGGTPSWSRITPAGTPPTPRDAHTAVLNAATNRLVVFAGRTCTSCTGPDFVALNDTWMLTDANGVIGSAPTLSYTPAPPTLIGLPGGALNAVVQSEIDIQSIGGAGAGQVQLACSVAAPFTLPAGGSRTIAVGAAPTSLAIGCTLGGFEQSGNLSCVETDTPGGATRPRNWPLICPAGSAASILGGNAVANRGGAVAIDVSVIGDGVVHSVVGDLVFDKTLLTPTQVAPANGGNCFLLPPNDDRVRVNVPTGPAPLPEQQTTYCNVVFVVARNAAIADIQLPVTSATCLNGSNTPVPCLAIEGSITVSAFDSLPRPGHALSLIAFPGQASVTASIVASNFGNTPIDVASCTPDPASGYSVTPSAAFSIPAFDLAQINVGCTPPSAGLPPRVSDLSCLLQDTVPARVVRYRLLCSTASSLAPIPGASITGTGTGTGDEVGSSLASTIAANGDEIMVVGAPFAGADDGGRAFVIVRPAGSNPLAASAKRASGMAIREDLDLATAHALSATSAVGDKFGNAVAVNRAGDTIAVGAPFGGLGGAGRVFVFRKPTSGWTTLDTPALVIDAPQGTAAGDTVPDDFGAQVAFASNGTLVVGAPLSDVGTNAVDAGAAFAYAAASNYSQSGILRAPTVEPGAGFAAAIAGNGDALAIGAPLENAGGNTDQGAVHVMSAPGAPIEPTRTVTSIGGGVGDKFGSSVAFVNRTLVVGAPQDNTGSGTDAGSATVFSGDAGGNFIETMTIEPAGGAGQQAGAAVATNGDVILIGVPFATVDGRVAQGRVYAYDAPQSVVATPSSATIIDSAAGQSGDRFGAYLATSARRLLIGAPKDDNELGLGGTTVQVDEGRADPLLLDRISRAGFE